MLQILEKLSEFDCLCTAKAKLLIGLYRYSLDPLSSIFPGHEFFFIENISEGFLKIAFKYLSRIDDQLQCLY